MTIEKIQAVEDVSKNGDFPFAMIAFLELI